MRRALLALLAALVLVPAAFAAGEVKSVDTAGFPRVKVTVVAPSTSTTPPSLEQNGGPVAGLTARNLGSSKSVMLVVDRSRSMLGQPLADATAAARAFVAAKPPEDRIAVLTYATQVVALTGFSTATIDADTALRSVAVDPVAGTKMNDAVVLSSNLLAAEPLASRVVILVTDGNETESEASLDDAIAAARQAGVNVYVVGIESDRFNPDPSGALRPRRAVPTTAPHHRQSSRRSTTRSPRTCSARGSSST